MINMIVGTNPVTQATWVDITMSDMDIPATKDVYSQRTDHIELDLPPIHVAAGEVPSRKHFMRFLETMLDTLDLYENGVPPNPLLTEPPSKM
jgi:hypothetical protein